MNYHEESVINSNSANIFTQTFMLISGTFNKTINNFPNTKPSLSVCVSFSQSNVASSHNQTVNIHIQIKINKINFNKKDKEKCHVCPTQSNL